MKRKKSCSNCIKGIKISINSDILCRKKGIVSPDYVCSGHRFEPESFAFKEMNYKCIDCESFILNTKSVEDPESIGVCKLFSARQFDGTQKSACSKFVKKSISAMSSS
ncbi:MAG TPA: hypothetical protein GXX36_13625 [Clostridiaceae bacterium]|nr:hypothetical protein [Clostridiaceae bacterium]